MRKIPLLLTRSDCDTGDGSAVALLNSRYHHGFEQSLKIFLREIRVQKIKEA